MNQIDSLRIVFWRGSSMYFQRVAALFFICLFFAAIQSRTQTAGNFDLSGVTPSQTDYYVAPNGSPAGNGSINSPWDLKTALNSGSISPGSTIWMRGGTYYLPSNTEGFVSNLNGTAANPIRIMSFPGEWAVIDGRILNTQTKNVPILKVFGSHTWFLNFEVTNSDPSGRKIPIVSSNPIERRGNSIDDYGTGTKIINLIIHDTGQGIGAWQQGRDNEYYGNVVYNNGWDAPDRTHGHANYIQNQLGTKVFEDNFFFNQFSMNGRTGGTDAANVNNVSYIGNVFLNGWVAWKGPHLQNFKVLNNYFFNNVLKVGDEINSTYRSAEVRGNYAMGGVQLFEFVEPLIFENNTVWNNYPNGKLLILNHSSSKGTGRFIINNNTYHRSFMVYPYWNFRVNYYGGRNMLPMVRRKTGDLAYDSVSGTQQTTYSYTRKAWRDEFVFDSNSNYVDQPPTGLKVFVKQNRFDSRRANVVIYNWDDLPVVGIDVSAVLNPGDTYELRNVQDYFNDVISGTFTGGLLQVQMTGRTLAKPIGYDQVSSWYHDPLQPVSFPTFGTFVLIKTN